MLPGLFRAILLVGALSTCFCMQKGNLMQGIEGYVHLNAKGGKLR